MANVAHATLSDNELHRPVRFTQDTEPGSPVAGDQWLAPSTGVLKQRNEAGDGWITITDAQSHAPVTVSDSSSIDLTLTGQQISAAAIFGTTAGTVAPGNHTHALADLDDTAVTSPADGDGLYYDAGTATWVNAQPPAGFSNPMTTEDDLIVGGASGAPGRLGKGTDGQVLTVDPTTHHLIWADPPSGGGGLTDPTTTKGDLIARDASAVTRLGVGTDGQVLTANSAAATGMSWQDVTGDGGSAVAPVLPWISGRYYDTSQSITPKSSSGSVAIPASQLWFTPLLVPSARSVDRIGVYVNAAAATGSLARLGLYALGADGFPGALLLDAGAIAIDATGPQEIIISQALPAGWVYAVYLANAQAQVMGWGSGSYLQMYGQATLTNLGSGGPIYSVAQTYGALPNPFPAGTLTAQAGMIRLALRAA